MDKQALTIHSIWKILIVIFIPGFLISYDDIAVQHLLSLHILLIIIALAKVDFGSDPRTGPVGCNRQNFSGSQLFRRELYDWVGRSGDKPSANFVVHCLQLADFTANVNVLAYVICQSHVDRSCTILAIQAYRMQTQRRLFLNRLTFMSFKLFSYTR